MIDTRTAALVDGMWRTMSAGAPPLETLDVTGPERILPSVFDVTTFATSAVATATLAAAELLAAREESPPRPVTVDRRRAVAAFLAEHLFRPDGWDSAPLADEISGDYRTRDGWIRLHTTYANHRAAALTALGVDAERSAVTRAVAGWERDALESAIVDEGGCAAAMQTRDEWLAHPAGVVASQEPAVAMSFLAALAAPTWAARAHGAPLAGIRVLDVTHAIAGPVCTQFLAAYGADVLRIDHPGFEEVPPLEPVTTAGKRLARLDLRSTAGNRRFADLLDDADVLVCGLRPDALAGLGFDDARLAAEHPGLVLVRLDAYGWHGPWAQRRGFDSLVQMSSGIAAAGGVAAANGSDGASELVAPRPLPAQALDHGTGYLLAAATCRALARQVTDGTTAVVRASLVGTSNLLVSTLDPEVIPGDGPTWTDDDTVPVATAWGPARAAPVASSIAGVDRRVLRPGGPLGSDDATFE